MATTVVPKHANSTWTGGGLGPSTHTVGTTATQACSGCHANTGTTYVTTPGSEGPAIRIPRAAHIT